MGRALSFPAIVCVGLTAAILTTLPIAPADATSTSSVSGTYQRLVADPVDGRTGDTRDLVVAPHGRTYRVSGAAATGLRPGAQVRLHGTGKATATAKLAVKAAGAAPASAPTRRLRVLGILATWTTPDSVTREQMTNRLFTEADAWFQEVSYGLTSLQGDVTPWVQIAGPDGGLCYTNHRQIADQAATVARAQGFDAAGYDKVVVYFPRSEHPDCRSYSGWAYEPGAWIWLNGRMDLRTTVHELGHSLGLRHASSLSCKDRSRPVVVGGTCTRSEYGDIADAMGQSRAVAQFSAVGKESMGWLGDRALDLSRRGTAVLSPLGARAATPVVAKVVVGKRTYYLEYRRATGVDSVLQYRLDDGLVVHLVDPAFGANSMLLDLHPGGTLRDAALKPGSSWTTPEGIRVKVGTLTASGLPVTVG